MAAPEGNQFWKLRSKHGRDKIFQTPEILWEAACEYFEWCDNNPLKKTEAKSVSGGKEPGSIETVELPLMMAYTLHGLCIYLGVNTKYFNDFEAAKHEGFSEVITRIREVIYTQKFTGAAAGLLNQNIIARDLGLTDKKEVEKKVTRLDFKDAQ